MRDGSFEKSLWSMKSSGMANSPLCTREDEPDWNSANAAAADGVHYLWFGGYDFYFTQSATLERQTIPRDATHIAMFVSENVPASTDWRSSLFLRIDGTQVLHIDRATQHNFTALYRNVDVDIRKYANGREHTLELFFSAEESGASPSIFVDYLRFIRDETCLWCSSFPPSSPCVSHDKQTNKQCKETRRTSRGPTTHTATTGATWSSRGTARATGCATPSRAALTTARARQTRGRTRSATAAPTAAPTRAWTSARGTARRRAARAHRTPSSWSNT